MKLIDTSSWYYNWEGGHVVKERLDRAPLILYFEGVTDVAWRIPPSSTNILLQACGLGGYSSTVSIAMFGPLILPWSQDYEGCKLYKAMLHRERIVTAILQLAFYHGSEKERAQFTCPSQPVEFYTSNLNDAPSNVKEAFALLTGHNVSPWKAVQSFVTDATRALLDIEVQSALGMYGKSFNTDQSFPKQPTQEPEHEPIETGAAHPTQQEQYTQAKPSTRCATRTPSKWEQASKVAQTQMLLSQKERLLILETMHGAVNTVQRVLDYDQPPKNETTATVQVTPAATSVPVPLQTPTPPPPESKATSFSRVDELNSALKDAQERIRRLALMLEVKTSENLEMNEKFARHGSNFSKRKGRVGQKGKAGAKRISIQARGKHDKAKKININQGPKIDHNRSISRPPFK